MKSICLLFVLLLSAGARAQCGAPVSNTDFQNAFNQIAVQQVASNKLVKALDFINANCLSATQAKTLAQLFGNDTDRLQFCKAAYPRIYDRQNYYEVYDAFTSNASIIRLHDFVLGWATGDPPVTAPAIPVPAPSTPPPAKPIAFPKWTYPTSDAYSGTKGCAGPIISQEDFNELATLTANQPTDESRQVTIQNAANEQCLDLQQVMKLISLVKSESVRYNTLSAVFPSVFDQEHYSAAAAVFPTPAMKTKWTGFASEYLTPAPPPCTVSANDFKSAVNAVNAKHFADERLAVVDLLAKDRCFTVDQIRTISQAAPFGEEKMTMFKKLYPKCTDKPNYYKLVNELKFTHEQEEMNEFIKKN